MNNIKFLKYFLLTSILLSPIEHANAGKGKLVLEGLEFFGGRTLSRSFTPGTYSRRAFFSTLQRNNPQPEREEMTDKTNTINKKLQVVDVGKKDYKFDPKTSMYYYEDKGNKELQGTKKPELKEFDTFVEFDVKKK